MPLQKNFVIIFASIVTLMLLSLLLYTEVLENEENILASAAKRYDSYLLADELRQSSDDLTRMARTYAVTGDPKYKAYFDTILAIRNGEASRPMEYHNIYWDFFAATGMPPRVDTPPKALKELMKEADFTETEFALLRETENESNELVNLENQAMNAMVGIFTDSMGDPLQGEPDRELARNLLHGDAYHHAKEKIMKPLERFFDTLDHRTSGEIAVYREKQRRANLVLIMTLSLSALLALVSLILGILSLREKKSADTAKSRLAQRMAASGYPSRSAANRGPAESSLFKRLATAVSSFGVKRDSEEKTEESSVSFFITDFWNNWPLIVASVVIAFLILGLSWWFVSENRIQSYQKVREELKFTLDVTHDAVLDWLVQTNRDVANLAEAVSRRVSHETLQRAERRPDHALHHELTDLIIAGATAPGDAPAGEEPGMFADASNVAGTGLFQDYVVVSQDGTVLSSNQPDLLGNHLALPADDMQRLTVEKTIIHFPDRSAASDLLSRNIVFGSLLAGGRSALFVMTSPVNMLATILRRGYLGNYGEIYLVDGDGHFLSEPRWKEEMYDKGWLDPDTSSVVGMRAGRDGTAAGDADLPMSVRSVITGQDGGELAEYANYLGDEVVGYWLWDNTHGFGMINEFKSADAFATFRAFTNQALAGSWITVGLILALTLMSIWSRTKVAQSGEKLKNAFKTIKAHNDKLAQDLRIGQKVQTDMLPDPIEGEGFTLEAFLKPAQSVSGDFYDYSVMRDGKLYFCVGDVSGKGIPASLFMSMSKALLDKIIDQTDQTKDIITRINQELATNNDSNMFVTMVLGIVDLDTGTMLLTNGGHNLPYIKKHNGEVICLEQVDGPLVGTFDGIEFEQQSIEMEKGDMVLFYTDGVTEAQNIRDQFYDDDRLKDLLVQNEFATAHDMTNAVLRSVVRFIGRADQFDDITILSFQYTGP